MKNKKIVHIIKSEKFIPQFIDLLKKLDGFNCHSFHIFGDCEKFKIDRSENVIIQNNIFSVVDLVRASLHAEKIILHGLFDAKIILFIFLQPWLLNKCYWFIWGGDLYSLRENKQTLILKIKNFFRRPLIRRIGHLVTYVEGDVDLARAWCSATGKYHECIMYPSNIYRELPINGKPRATLNIQIGNSADPSNNHFEILEWLLPFRDHNIAIYAPLSYGDRDYAQSLIKAAETHFGDKFKPLIDFIPFDGYLEFLDKIDIAIFNHRRQQGMGNIITLLGLGKKVYLRNDVTPWNTFERIGVKVYDVSCIDSNPIEDEIRRRNQALIKRYFSEKMLVDQLKKIFEG